MESRAAATSLAKLPVVVLDAQATAANPARGALIELGWARGTAAAPPGPADIETCIVAPPPGASMPRAVARVTGIAAREWELGVTADAAWCRVLATATELGPGPVPLVIHFARFEEPYLRALHSDDASAPFPFELLCTHAIARRLLPGLPRCTLRALAGYFGAAVAPLRRSGEHVLATAFVWRHLVDELELEDVTDLGALRDWLQRPRQRPTRACREYPLPRERRRQLPRGPGVYRFLRAGGTVVYVGKAASLRQRVNGHFHGGDGERALEMLSQVREVSCSETATALEAALLETDEIKSLAPAYNRALTASGRSLWFATAELGDLREAPDARHGIGPLPSPLPFQSLAALRRALATDAPVPLAERATAVGVEPAWAPSAACFAAGRARFIELHGPLASARAVLRLGARLWADRRPRQAEASEEDAAATRRASEWDADRVLAALEETVLRAAHAVRRGRWLIRLSESSLAWSETGSERTRLLAIESGAVAAASDLPAAAPVPLPAGACRSPAERRAAFDVPTFDRMRVLTTELRSLAACAPAVELRLGVHARLSRRRLKRVLQWV